MNVLVIGASRGIGFEFVRQYRAEGATVTASARNNAGLERIRGLGADASTLDVTDPASGSAFAAGLQGRRFDVIVVNAGVIGGRVDPPAVPEQADFDHVMRTNVLGPMRMISLVAPMLAPGGRLAVLSSRMASIGSRTSAANWLYRASKAALNSVLMDAALVLGERATCVALHPGWVRTDMGGSSADIDVETSVSGMRRVIAALVPGERCSFRNYDGETIPW
ncbi:SDR family oxidoreductase [Piscinibacter koreensis]|uniref:SDR family oxidoreductase n=1 Tax=Piscinibacter koreensis TaxID=2742824 RepID=A0A7Y6NNP5_9BURK|nr:SDR family oxidoreductase [Schlegelella koreensis]NUZ06510.1 SDR family oxidoreductase [Schlegelella koreensis]